MRLMLTLTSALLLAAGGWAAEITVTSDPPLPVPNLIVNGDIEQGAGDKAASWAFGTANPENFETGWRDGGRSGKCLWMKAKTGVMSGYYNQAVPVEPGKQYLFKGFYRLAAGKLLAYANSSLRLPDGRSVAVDERFYQGTMRGHWLVPVFLPPDALGGPDPNAWLPFRLDVKVPEGMKWVSLSLGLYFQPGEVCFDDLWAGLAQTDLTIGAKAAVGETLSRVVVKAVGVDKPVLDSGALKAGSTDFSTVVKAQATDAVYEVTVTQGDGKVVVRRYPDGEVR